jgi:hypothetical protein
VKSNRVNLNIAESTMWRLNRALLPSSTTEPFAIATGVGIRNEAILRRVLARSVNSAMKLVGRETTAMRRRHREVADAAQFHSVSEDGRCPAISGAYVATFGCFARAGPRAARPPSLRAERPHSGAV